MTTPAKPLFLTELKHGSYYMIEGERVQFRAEIGKISFFRVPVAKFTWPDGTVREVTIEPMTQNNITYGWDVPFFIEYKTNLWRAELRVTS